MSNGLVDDDKKMVEPFNLYGKRSFIYSKEEAAKILKDNSYYIFVAAVLNVIILIFLFIYPIDVGISKEHLLFQGIIFCALGVGVRKYKSRIASLLVLGIFGSSLLIKILQEGRGGFYLFFFIFCLASYRAVKASFYYHKKMVEEENAE
jgi:hypothetical protein